MIVGAVPGREAAEGPQEVGDGAPASGQDGGEQEDDDRRRVGSVNAGASSASRGIASGGRIIGSVLGRWPGKRVQLPMLPPRRTPSKIGISRTQRPYAAGAADPARTKAYRSPTFGGDPVTLGRASRERRGRRSSPGDLTAVVSHPRGLWG